MIARRALAVYEALSRLRELVGPSVPLVRPSPLPRSAASRRASPGLRPGSAAAGRVRRCFCFSRPGSLRPPQKLRVLEPRLHCSPRRACYRRQHHHPGRFGLPAVLWFSSSLDQRRMRRVCVRHATCLAARLDRQQRPPSRRFAQGPRPLPLRAARALRPGPPWQAGRATEPKPRPGTNAELRAPRWPTIPETPGTPAALPEPASFRFGSRWRSAACPCVAGCVPYADSQTLAWPHPAGLSGRAYGPPLRHGLSVSAAPPFGLRRSSAVEASELGGFAAS